MIIPGLGLLYGGLARRKSALAMLYQAFGVVSSPAKESGAIQERDETDSDSAIDWRHHLPVDVLGIHPYLLRNRRTLHW